MRWVETFVQEGGNKTSSVISASRQIDSLTKAGFHEKNSINSTARVIQGDKTLLVHDTLKRQFEHVGQNQFSDRNSASWLERTKFLQSAFQFENTVKDTPSFTVQGGGEGA